MSDNFRNFKCNDCAWFILRFENGSEKIGTCRRASFANTHNYVCNLGSVLSEDMACPEFVNYKDDPYRERY